MRAPSGRSSSLLPSRRGIVAAGLPGISGYTAVLAYALCALTPVACAIAALADYWKTLYGQRGYFTMSLPISGKVVFWAKNTRIMIECLLALALAVGGILAVASAAAWSDGISLAEYTAGPRSLVAGVPTSTVALMIAVQIILAMSWVVQACAAMTIGAEGRFNHLGFGAPIIGFVLLYIVNQVLSTVGTFFLPLSVTTDGHFSTEIMWTSYRATMGSRGATERHRHRLLCPRAPVRPDPGPVGVPLDREAHVLALSA